MMKISINFNSMLWTFLMEMSISQCLFNVTNSRYGQSYQVIIFTVCSYILFILCHIIKQLSAPPPPPFVSIIFSFFLNMINEFRIRQQMVLLFQRLYSIKDFQITLKLQKQVREKCGNLTIVFWFAKVIQSGKLFSCSDLFCPFGG